jgi:hypothetical protein
MSEKFNAHRFQQWVDTFVADEATLTRDNNPRIKGFTGIAPPTNDPAYTLAGFHRVIGEAATANALLVVAQHVHSVWRKHKDQSPQEQTRSIRQSLYKWLIRLTEEGPPTNKVDHFLHDYTLQQIATTLNDMDMLGF